MSCLGGIGMNIDSIVGSCTWKACEKCQLYNSDEGCTYHNPSFVVRDGDVYCLEFYEV